MRKKLGYLMQWNLLVDRTKKKKNKSRGQNPWAGYRVIYPLVYIGHHVVLGRGVTPGALSSDSGMASCLLRSICLLWNHSRALSLYHLVLSKLVQYFGLGYM